ncbi:MAG: hypothetical protein WC889_12550, partial [Myxococcota bacterium]
YKCNYAIINTDARNQPKVDPMKSMYTGCLTDGWCMGLDCSAMQCRLDPVPQKHDFGRVTKGCASAEQLIKIYNNGNKAINITKFEMAGDTNSSFVLTKNPATPFPVAAGAYVEVKIKYKPTASGLTEGQAENATFNAYSDCDPTGTAPVTSVPLNGTVTLITDQTDTFKVPDKPTVDILWCIDNSGSMDDDQQAMAANFPKFMQYLTSFNSDFQIGTVTSEVNDTYDQDGGKVAPGLLYAKNGYPRIIANVPPASPTAPYLPKTTKYQEAFQANATPGSCCSDAQEACLQAVKLTLSEPNISDVNANAGFVRKMAKLVIIMMSDEVDQSDDGVDFYADFLLSVKGARNTTQLSVSVIAELDKNFDPANPTDFPVGADCAAGQQTGGAGTKQALLFKKVYGYTNQGLALNICEDTWGTFMSKLGLEGFVPPTQYFLSRAADESTIEVTLDGVAVDGNDAKKGYTYDQASNSIIFGPEAPLNKGSTIVVKYTAQCYT